MPNSTGRLPSAVITGVLLIIGCSGHTIVDDWPTYEVRGTVRTAGGTPVAAVLVELKSYGEAGCGLGPLIALSPAITNANGQYRAQQDEFSGTLSGCLRLAAHRDTSRLSDVAAIVDLPVENVMVVEGETTFTVDLSLP